MKRKEDFLKRKSGNFKTIQSEPKKNIFVCNQCVNTFKSENDLQIHKENVHEEIGLSENIEQLDGHTDLEDSEITIEGKVDSKETQTGVFIKADKEGFLVEPFLDLLYDSPTPTVYHPIRGLGTYHSTEACKDNRKAHCYRFENGYLCDV